MAPSAIPTSASGADNMAEWQSEAGGSYAADCQSDGCQASMGPGVASRSSHQQVHGAGVGGTPCRVSFGAPCSSRRCACAKPPYDRNTPGGSSQAQRWDRQQQYRQPAVAVLALVHRLQDQHW
ncbi:hypothetical protein TSOC_002162 [Tetrabaena socialis]|uniref:Uncharacterized protein n=1 Tax=Tetrabaena socialis TaxID=47790 RepID=A0A2J8AES0_9CHLO|nr:hypothetical protein TSOC_002162 [Tetrabaena socialis]|eukprot:PNH11017.1 hypothetical protein TSOC_002162 [Tetrabaena socialis]